MLYEQSRIGGKQVGTKPQLLRGIFVTLYGKTEKLLVHFSFLHKPQQQIVNCPSFHTFTVYFFQFKGLQKSWDPILNKLLHSIGIRMEHIICFQSVQVLPTYIIPAPPLLGEDGGHIKWDTISWDYPMGNTLHISNPITMELTLNQEY